MIEKTEVVVESLLEGDAASMVNINLIRNSFIKFKLPRTIVDMVFNKPFDEIE